MYTYINIGQINTINYVNNTKTQKAIRTHLPNHICENNKYTFMKKKLP